MTTTDPTTVAPPTLPEATPAFWIHWLNLAIQAVAFVGVVVHPGWHPPALLPEIVAPVSLAMATVSGAVVAASAHGLKKVSLSAAYDYLHRNAAQLAGAAERLAPVIDEVPAIKSRLSSLEAAATVATTAAGPAGPGPAVDVAHLLQALVDQATTKTTDPAAASQTPPAAGTVTGAPTALTGAAEPAGGGVAP